MMEGKGCTANVLMITNNLLINKNHKKVVPLLKFNVKRRLLKNKMNRI